MVLAAILEAPATDLVLERIDIQEPKRGEVLVRLAASGVCHSDLHVVHGTQTTPLPVVLGHEGAGVVEAIGPEVKRVYVGDHVVLSWTPSCGQCAFCQSGHPNLCTVVYETMGNGTSGEWNGYTYTNASGPGLEVLPWLHEHQVAAVASDTWAFEAVPSKTPLWLPIHALGMVYMGLMLGENFLLEEWASHCAGDGVYEAFICAGPIPFSRAVGAPVNPIVIK